MATANTNLISTEQSSESPAESQRRPDGQGAGRGRGRGHSRAQDFSDGQSRRQEGAGGRRGRGSSRGANSSHGKVNSNTMNTSDLQARFAPQPTTTVQLEQLQEVAGQVQGAREQLETEAELCFICASSVEHYSVAPCNHRTCHICTLRMRALYKTKDCAHCRTEAQYVIFTDDPTKRYEEYTSANTVSTDENIGIKYERTDIVEDTLLLLRYNCPDPSCDVACLGWPDLHRHVRSVHHKRMCDLCTRNKKVFTHEHELFTDKELERHMRKGDDNPGAVDQSGFRGHPLCGFCGERFYGDDELYVHCRERHERCFICDRRDGRQPQYYVNYEALEIHFRKDHFLCPERECLEKKFIVFPTEIDLKAHQLEEHGNTLSKDVRRDARIVDMASFDYRAPYVQERRSGSQREGGGRGRGRDPNTDSITASSAQPLRRDEQAFQRQMAIQSAQSVSTRTFGGQLTSIAAPPGTRDPPSMTVPRTSSNIDNIASQYGRMDLQPGGAEITPQEQARKLRHAAVIERAATLLQNDQLKLNQFRNAISSFRTNKISAPALIDSFFALFSDTSSNALGSLIRDVADLYEDSVKAESLRTAWNDWRAINEDYPSLPGPSGMRGSALPLGWAQVTSSTPSTAPAPSKSTSRVLKLKSSTQQSSRSNASRNASWGSASASSANGFPGLPNPNPNVANTLTSRVAGAAPRPAVGGSNSWGTSTPSPSSSAPTSRPASTGPSKTATGVLSSAGPDAFPALPPAKKPTSTIFGYGTGAVRRDIGGNSSSGFAWGNSAASSSANIAEARTEGEAVGQANEKKKGNKGKKEVLAKWG